MAVIRYVEDKYWTIDISGLTNLCESTIRGIKKNSEAIKKAYNSLQNRSIALQTKIRDENIMKMEEMLYAWILDCNDKNIEIDSIICQEKARKILNNITKDTNNLLKPVMADIKDSRIVKI